MKAGYLSEFFAGVALKTLSAVEADMSRSHQHEFNGVQDLIRVFGRAVEKHSFTARFIYLTDDDDQPVVEDATVTWYDARVKHPTRTEHRLYFPTTGVSQCAAEGDLLVIGKRQDGSVLVIVAQGGSTIAGQIRWLFGVPDTAFEGFSIREELETEQDRVQFASTFILEQIGIVVDQSEETYLDTMLTKFGGIFPTTRRFSGYARSTLTDVNAAADPDGALMAWMEREEILFRTLEKHLLAERLSQGFADNSEGFLQFALSVLNRRKSRVGLALENHLEVIFTENKIHFGRAALTEGKAKPDFLFPGRTEYANELFDKGLLTMLGVKSTCKDRWRQVLTEAARIETKHLLTLEAAISRDQTRQMQQHHLQLVIPRKLQSTYSAEQVPDLIDLETFIRLVRDREAVCPALMGRG
jgi:hypothetical protein